LQVGGVSKLKIYKDGVVQSVGGTFQTSAQGTAAIPSFGFVNSGTTVTSGIAAGIGYADVVVANAIVARATSTRGVEIGLSLGYSWSSPSVTLPDLSLFRDAAQTLAQRNGTNAQTFRLYNTFTDASNYERGFMRWNTNVLEIGAEKAGTGLNRIVSFFANGSSVASIGLGGTPGAASADANHSWLMFRNGMGIAQFSNTMRVFTNSQDHFTDIGGNSATYPQLRVTRDSIIFSRYTMSATDTFRIYIQDEGGQDKAHKHLQINAEDAAAANTVNITGGNLVLRGGVGASGSAGTASGGSVTIRGGTGYGTGTVGNIIMDTLPTSATGLPTGALWNNSGVLSIA